MKNSASNKTQDETTLESLALQYGEGVGTVNISIRNNIEYSVVNQSFVINGAYRCVESALHRFGVKTKSTMPAMGLGAGGFGFDPTFVNTIIQVVSTVLPGVLAIFRNARHRYRVMKSNRSIEYHPNISVRLRIEQIEDISKIRTSLSYLAFMLQFLNKEFSSNMPNIKIKYLLLAHLEGIGKICLTITPDQAENTNSMDRLAKVINESKCADGNITFIYKKKHGYGWKADIRSISKKQLGLLNLDLYANSHP